jgi:hypothetical protein
MTSKEKVQPTISYINKPGTREVEYISIVRFNHDEKIILTYEELLTIYAKVTGDLVVKNVPKTFLKE